MSSVPRDIRTVGQRRTLHPRKIPRREERGLDLVPWRALEEVVEQVERVDIKRLPAQHLGLERNHALLAPGRGFAGELGPGERADSPRAASRQKSLGERPL